MTDQPKPKRRWLQYSLRTLFIVVTVFCVWMGITAKRARDQRLAVEMILALDGNIIYEHLAPYQSLEEDYREYGGFGSTDPEETRLLNNPPGPEWLRTFIGDDYFFSVHSVKITVQLGYEQGEAVIEAIGRLNDLRVLDLNLPVATDADLSKLKDLKQLQTLDIWTGDFTDVGLSHLGGLTNLKKLWIFGAKITDAGLVHLEGLTNLESLHLDGPITDAGLVHLEGLKNLEFLNLSTNKCTSEGVRKLHQSLPNCHIDFLTPGGTERFRPATDSPAPQR